MNAIQKILYMLDKAVVVLTIAMVATGCEHKDLCEHGAYADISVVFDWRAVPDADPEGMCVYFYPQQEGLVIRRVDFKGRDGGKVKMLPGKYDIIAYNNDCSYAIAEATEAYMKHTLTSVLASGHEELSAILAEAVDNHCLTPERLFLATLEDAEIEMMTSDFEHGTVKSRSGVNVVDGNTTIILTPEDISDAYTFEIRNVQNVESLAKAYCTLSNMRSGVSASTLAGAGTTTYAFEGTLTADHCIVGRFYSYGHCDDGSGHRFLLYAVLADGSVAVIGADADAYDVTSQIHEAADPRRVHLVIDGASLPVVSGFRPGIGDWEEIYEEF